MKHIIVGGCSFTQGDQSWATALGRSIPNSVIYNTGAGSSGNEMISRRVIHKIEELEKEIKFNDNNVLVGIMWSSYARNVYYAQTKTEYDRIFSPHSYKIWKYRNDIENYCLKNKSANPHKWPHNDTGVWLQATAGMDYTHHHKFLNNFFNETHETVKTLEHVIRTQLYLEKKKIKYFMVPYMDSWIPKKVNKIQTEYLMKMIDWNQFLPVTSNHAWIAKESTKPWRNAYENDHHPSYDQHDDFVQKIVMPWLKEKKYVE